MHFPFTTYIILLEKLPRRFREIPRDGRDLKPAHFALSSRENVCELPVRPKVEWGSMIPCAWVWIKWAIRKWSCLDKMVVQRHLLPLSQKIVREPNLSTVHFGCHCLCPCRVPLPKACLYVHVRRHNKVEALVQRLPGTIVLIRCMLHLA